MEQLNAFTEVERLREENKELQREIMKLEQKGISKEEAKLLRQIQKCKIELKKQDLKKSGYNGHNKYHYFELDDFLACVEIILDKHGLASFFYFDGGVATLTICDEEGNSHKWNTKCVPAKPRENGYDVGVHMKSEQAIQTYARRTLWLQAMEITEPNAIENDGKGQQKKAVAPKRNVPHKKKQKRADELIKPVKQEKDKDTSATRIQEILREAQRVFDEAQEDKKEEDRKPFSWENAKMVIRRLCDNETEFEICKQATVFKTADNV